MRTLVLNAGYEPLAVVSYKRAIVLVMNEKASIIAAVVAVLYEGLSVNDMVTRLVDRPPRTED